MNNLRLIIYLGIGLILFVYFFPPLSKSKFHEPIKSIFWGIILMLGACWFVYEMVGNPLDELALIRRAHVTTGTLVDTYEADHDTYTREGGVYVYQLPDGQEFKIGYEPIDGNVKEIVEVEYLSDRPSVSRVIGDVASCTSIFEFIWRKIGIGIFLLVVFSSFGFIYLKSGILEARKIYRISKGVAVDKQNEK